MIHKVKKEELKQYGLYENDECAVVITKAELRKGRYFDEIVLYNFGREVYKKEFDKREGQNNAKEEYDKIISKL